MATTDSQDGDQQKLWNGQAGRAWVEAQATLDQMFLPFEDDLSARDERVERCDDRRCVGHADVSLCRSGGRGWSARPQSGVQRCRPRARFAWHPPPRATQLTRNRWHGPASGGVLLRSEASAVRRRERVQLPDAPAGRRAGASVRRASQLVGAHALRCAGGPANHLERKASIALRSSPCGSSTSATRGPKTIVGHVAGLKAGHAGMPA